MRNMVEYKQGNIVQILTEVTEMILVCNVCGYEYDTEAEGEMPEDFVCPVCGVDKTNFSEI